MEPLREALRLMKREVELRERFRKPGGIRVAEERELFVVHSRLQAFPAAVRAVIDAAQHLHRPVDLLSLADVERGLIGDISASPCSVLMP